MKKDTKEEQTKKKPEQIIKDYSPTKAGKFYLVTSKYFIPRRDPECFFILANNNDSFNICVTKIILTSVVRTMWDVKFDEMYIDGGTRLNLVPFNRSRQLEEYYPKNVLAVSADRDNYSTIKVVGGAGKGPYKVTSEYDTQDILGGDEIILGKDNSVCIYARAEAGVSAPVNCEIRFYIE